MDPLMRQAPGFARKRIMQQQVLVYRLEIISRKQ